MQFFHTAKTFYWIARTASLHYLISLKSFGLFLHGSLQHVFKEKGRRYFGARAFSLPPQSTRLVCTVKHNWKSCSEISARKKGLPLNPLSSLKLATSLISFIIIYKDKCSYDVHKFKHSSQKKFLISSCFQWESISGYCIWIFVQHNYTSHYQMCLFFWSNHQHSTIKILCNHYSLRWRFFSVQKWHKMLLLTIDSSILVRFPNKLFENNFQLWFTVAWLVHTWRIAPNSVSLVLFTLCYLGWKTMEIDGENWTQDIGGQPNPAGSFCQFFFFRFQKRIRVRLLWFTRIQKDCYLTSVLKS